MKNQYFGDSRDLFKYDLLSWLITDIPDICRTRFSVAGPDSHYYISTFRNILTRMPIPNDIAAIPRLMPAISMKRRQNGRSLAIDV